MTGQNRILPVLWRRRWTFAIARCLSRRRRAVTTAPSEGLLQPRRTSSSPLRGPWAATSRRPSYADPHEDLLRADRDPGIAEDVERRAGVAQSSYSVAVTAVPQSQLLVLKPRPASARGAQELANAYADGVRRPVRELEQAREHGGHRLARRGGLAAVEPGAPAAAAQPRRRHRARADRRPARRPPARPPRSAARPGRRRRRAPRPADHRAPPAQREQRGGDRGACRGHARPAREPHVRQLRQAPPVRRRRVARASRRASRRRPWRSAAPPRSWASRRSSSRPTCAARACWASSA